MTVQTVTLIDTRGEPGAHGFVRVIPQTEFVDSGGAAHAGRVTSAYVNGALSLQVVASDSAGNIPSPVLYTIKRVLGTGSTEWTNVLLQASVPTVNLDDLETVPGSDQVTVAIVTQVDGVDPDATGNVQLGAATAGALTAEATTRAAADTANANAISTEATTRATADTAHAGAADPHPGYLTSAEGNAAYEPTGTADAIVRSLRLVPASGAAQTLDASVAVEQDVILTANTTITLAGAVAGKLTTISVWFRQDATGGRTVTQPGNVTPVGQLVIDDAPNALTLVTYASHDGGSSWLAWSSVSNLATAEDLYGLFPSGEETVPLINAASVAVPVSQALALTYFTARKTETISKVTVCVGSTASAGLTLCRFGVWTADTAGALLTQVAATPNDAVTLLNTASQAATKAFTTPFTKRRGQRYAVGLLQVGTTPARCTAVAWQGGAISGTSPMIDRQLRRTGQIASQADLPASALSSALTTFGFSTFALLEP